MGVYSVVSRAGLAEDANWCLAVSMITYKNFNLATLQLETPIISSYVYVFSKKYWKIKFVAAIVRCTIYV